MDLKTAIHTRRSVRKYKSTPVPKELVLEILRVGEPGPLGHEPPALGIRGRSPFVSGPARGDPERGVPRTGGRRERRGHAASHKRPVAAGRRERRQAQGAGDVLSHAGRCAHRHRRLPASGEGSLGVEKQHQRLCRRHRKPYAGRLGQGVGHVLDDRAAESPGRHDRRLPGGPAGPGARGHYYSGIPGSPPPMPPKKDIAQKTRWLGFD